MRILQLTLLAILLWSCGKTPYYSETIPVSGEQWGIKDTLVFEIEVTDTLPVYEMLLVVDHDASYSYENIYLKIETLFPDTAPREEQLTIDLAENNGGWVGKCKGDNCQCMVVLLENFKFPSYGLYTFKINQYTREEQLAGINSLQLQVLSID